MLLGAKPGALDFELPRRLAGLFPALRWRLGPVLAALVLGAAGAGAANLAWERALATHAEAGGRWATRQLYRQVAVEIVHEESTRALADALAAALAGLGLDAKPRDFGSDPMLSLPVSGPDRLAENRVESGGGRADTALAPIAARLAWLGWRDPAAGRSAIADGAPLAPLDRNQARVWLVAPPRAGAVFRDPLADTDLAVSEPVPQTLRDALATGGEGPEMVLIPGGRFEMGAPEGEVGSAPEERPVHTVTLRPFYLAQHETTFAEYERFASATKRPLPDDNGWGRGSRPVINVSLEDVEAYARWLSEETGRRYRLPSETEWEYAARAGTRTRYWWGDEPRRGDEVMANCDGCGSEFDDKRTAPAGSFPANAFGLHDLHGNVWEWTADCWHGSYDGAPADGSAWREAGGGDCRGQVVRGGAWAFNAGDMRSAYRYWYGFGAVGNALGFRLARTP
jgi:formylglycine-generating enzyme required for sulfatase activity